MFLEIAVLGLGILISFFLKDINFLALNFVYPDFLLIFLIYFALRRGELSGIWIGFFAGLLEDSGIISESSGEFIHLIGTHIFFYTLAGFLLGKFNRFIDRQGMVPVVGVVFATTLIIRMFVWLTNGILQDFNRNYPFFAPSIYTALIAPIWFWLLGWVYRYTAGDEL